MGKPHRGGAPLECARYLVAVLTLESLPGMPTATPGDIPQRETVEGVLHGSFGPTTARDDHAAQRCGLPRGREPERMPLALGRTSAVDPTVVWEIVDVALFASDDEPRRHKRL